MMFARKRRVLVAGLATIGVLTLAPAIAQGAVLAASGPDFPTPVEVGRAQPYDASLTLFNLNLGGEAGLTNQLCNVGDLAPCGGVNEQGLQLVPTCAVLTASACTTAEPGVYQLSPTGVGSVATGGATCVGIIFDIIPIAGDPFGTVRFTPRGGAHVILPGGATCLIAFTFTVIKSPVHDQAPSASSPGIQTGSAADSTYCTAPCNVPGSLSARGLGTDSGTTVERHTPKITTIASPDALVSGQLTDQATVSDLYNPSGGATVTFHLFPPSSPSCAAGTEVFTDTQVVTLAGTVATATSGAFVPKVAGTGYHWIATYDSDLNNNPVGGACGEATETRNVTVPTGTPPPGTPEVCTTPPGPPPPGGHLCTAADKECTTPPGPAPAGGVLCAKGTAAIRGRTGCENGPFNVVVTGRQVETVTFAMDGKVVRRLTEANSGNKYLLKVTPSKLRLGVHRIVARTIFKKKSATKARTLRLTFSKCARRASAPAFTG
jgi:hypothetical protein